MEKVADAKASGQECPAHTIDHLLGFLSSTYNISGFRTVECHSAETGLALKPAI